ncbi:peptidylprolyl isomerase [Afifella pfennigii]|uniref:peptidylprolyl isomerase n=1 Tax=Afifella pfennigii TaxID=209897 RepID=UPI00146F9B4A|nr:peptidylprolyl isomerase [Afifella pfennigii]
MQMFKTERPNGGAARLFVSAGLVAMFLAAGLAPSAPALAQEPVARVGEQIITEDELSQAADDFADELDRVPGPRRRSVLIDVLVDMELLAQAARERGLDETEDFDKRLEFLKTRALRNEYVEKVIVGAVTDEQVQAEYDKQVAGFQPEEEVHARHILVTTKEEADEIIQELKDGKDFAELAKEKSTGPSGPQGGDLGYFVKGRMVPEFDQAVFDMQPGEVSEEPVKTEFGWHVIKVEDRRMSSPPPLEDISEQLRGVLVRQKFNDVMTELRDGVEIEVFDQAKEDEPAEGDTGGDAEAAPEEEPAQQ